MCRETGGVRERALAGTSSAVLVGFLQLLADQADGGEVSVTHRFPVLIVARTAYLLGRAVGELADLGRHDERKVFRFFEPQDELGAVAGLVSGVGLAGVVHRPAPPGLSPVLPALRRRR